MGLPRTGGFRGTYGKYKRSEAELKGVDTFSVVSPTDTPTVANNQIILLNGITQGSDYNNRIGREVVFKSIYVRISMYSSIGSQAPTQVRWMVFWDTQANNSAGPTFSDVLSPIGSAYTAVDAVSMNNLDHRDRFITVYDKVVSLNVQSTGNISFAFNKKYKKIKNIKTVFSGTGNTSGAIYTNALWLMLISNYATGSAAVPNVEYQVRLRYTDC